MRIARCVVILLAGCGRIGFDTGEPGAADAACTFGPFAPPVRVDELATPSREWAPSISRDGLEMIFSREVPASGQDLFAVTRSTLAAPWTGLTPLADLNTDQGEDDPTLSSDGLELIFGDGALLRSERVSTGFTTPQLIFSSADFVLLEGPELTADALTLYYNAARSGEPSRLYVATRVARDQPFTGFELLSPDPDPTGDAGWPTISSDGLELIFSSAHDGERDLWRSLRATVDDPFPAATRIDELAAPGEDYDPELSFDGSTLWFASVRAAGDHDIWVATRACL